MIEYRPFHNSDPPRIVALWNSCSLGRGTASDLSTDAFETVNFSQSYFDPKGLIVACDGDRVVGFVHAGFGANAEQTALSYESGVICAVLVHADYRRSGIGSELVHRAQQYLDSAGATTITAGPCEPCDPFYFGLYGGSQPCGFLESDPDAAPFFESLGYAPIERHAVFECDLNSLRAPMSFRLVSIRRQMQLSITHHPEDASWWWMTRFGRLDSLRFMLVPKNDGQPVASLTVIGLDYYLPKWQERSVGLLELEVPAPQQRKGYGQALVLDTCRRLREELVTRATAQVPETNAATLALLESTGFDRVDTGIVYRRR